MFVNHVRGLCLDKDITANVQERVTIYVNGMHDDGFIDDKTREYLIQTDVKPGRFYILPKVQTRQSRTPHRFI